MAWKLKVRDSFSELKRGVSYPRGYDVDESITTGIPMGSIITLKFDGTTVDGIYGNEVTEPTWILADGNDAEKKPYSVAFDTSLKDLYGGLDLDESVVKLPRNKNHENKPMDICKDTVVEWYDDVDKSKLYYRTLKTKLTGTVEVGSGTLTTVDGSGTLFTDELEVGDYIVVDGEVRQVTVITDDTTLTVGEAFSGAVAALTDIYADSTIGKPVWVGTSGTAGKFTHLKPAYASADTEVGKILTGKQVRLYLY